MINPLILLLASLPLTFRVVPLLVPERWLEPYAYWDAATLNARPGQRAGEVSQWRNMGWWEDTDDFSQAAEALARKLLAVADAKPGGDVLDVAHGAGESLALHLSTCPPPRTLHALTSLPSDTRAARALIAARFPLPNTVNTDRGDPEIDNTPARLECHSAPEPGTHISWYTFSATFRPGRHVGHPLDPMRGYLGRGERGEGSRGGVNVHGDEDDGDESAADDDDDDDGGITDRSSDGNEPALVSDDDDALTPSPSAHPPAYSLIYILDAIYHFPPSVPYFLAQALPALAPGGVLAYTDILPPRTLSPILAHLVLPPLLAVPARNLASGSRPASLEEYVDLLGRIGYVDVAVEDWSGGVWKGFARNLRSRGGVWRGVAWVVERAEKGGWRFVGVRARRPREGE